MSHILFVCVHNAGRSQMAKAFFNKLAEESCIPMRAESAGTQPVERIHLVVAEAMREAGIEISDVKPRLMSNEAVERAQQVITMGCAVDAEACPALLLRDMKDWGLPDPAGKDISEVRVVRDEVERKVAGLVERLRAETSLSPPS